MSTASLVHGELTVEVFCYRATAVIALLKKGEVVARVDRDLRFGWFALTVEQAGQRETLTAAGDLSAWRWTAEGVVIDQAGKPRWLDSLRLNPGRGSWRELVLYGLALASSYVLAAAALSPWSDALWRDWFIPVILFVIALFQAGACRRELDRQAALVVAV